jgi:hypothetical protein
MLNRYLIGMACRFDHGLTTAATGTATCSRGREAVDGVGTDKGREHILSVPSYFLFRFPARQGRLALPPWVAYPTGGRANRLGEPGC